jgi:hypothetical protein
MGSQGKGENLFDTIHLLLATAYHIHGDKPRGGCTRDFLSLHSDKFIFAFADDYCVLIGFTQGH